MWLNACSFLTSETSTVDLALHHKGSTSLSAQIDSYEMYQHMYSLLLFLFLVQMNSLVREKRFAVQDMPRDGNCHQALWWSRRGNVIWRESKWLRQNPVIAIRHLQYHLNTFFQVFLTSNPHSIGDLVAWLCHQNLVPSKRIFIIICSQHSLNQERTQVECRHWWSCVQFHWPV